MKLDWFCVCGIGGGVKVVVLFVVFDGIFLLDYDFVWIELWL